MKADMEETKPVRPAGNDSSSLLYFGGGRRMPVIRQSESAECGLACLAMMASYYGCHENLRSLRQRHAISPKGMTLGSLMKVAGTLGFACRPLRLDLDELKHLHVPCILHWDMDHFVVLRAMGKRRVTIHDPACGIRRLGLDEMGTHWTGVAVELSKGPEFRRKQPPAPVSLRKLAGSVQGLGRALTAVFSLALLLELISLLWPQFLQIVVDQVLADSDFSLLTLLGLSFAMLLLIQTTVTGLRTWTVMWLSMHFNLSWVGNVFQHLIRLPHAYFLKRHLGDIVSRFNAVSVIQQTLTTQFVGVILDGLMAVTTLVVMLIYSPLLALMVAVAMAVYAASRILYYRAYFEANLSQITVQARQQSEFMEAARGVQTIRLHNGTASSTARYLNAAADTLNTSIGVQKLNLAFDALNGMTSGAQRIGVLWLGAWLALSGRFSAGMLMAFVAYADQFTTRAAGLIDYLVQLKLLRLQGERLADIVMTAPESHVQRAWVGPEPEASIAFSGVSFRYAADEPWVLRDCSLHVAAGEFVAITGPSGCGKSTLVHVLLGLLDPQQGKIHIGQVDLKQLGKSAWRDMVGAVLQDDALFSGSIADNIAFRDEAAQVPDIERATRLAELHEDIVAMPMGYHTRIGDMGAALSGGQRQRLLLARALYRQPKVLILDEASSHLDTACEQRINAHLKELAITRIVIAHRQGTIQSADRILVCSKGRVHETRHPSVTDGQSTSESAVTLTENTQGGVSPIIAKEKQACEQ